MEAWNKLAQMSPEAVRGIQDKYFKELVQKEIPGHPYYRDKLASEGIDISSIKGLDDLKRLPFTEKEDIMPPGELMHPWKFVLEAPSEDECSKGGLLSRLFKKKGSGTGKAEYGLYQLFYTAGRTAEKPVSLVFTGRDIDNLQKIGLRSFEMWGFDRDYNVINAFSYFPHVSFWQQFYTTTHLQSTAIQTGGSRVLGTQRLAGILRNTGARVLMTFPGYADYLFQVLEVAGVSLPGLEAVVLGMEDASPELIDRIKAGMEKAGAADTRVYRSYFVSEAKAGWPECSPGCGYHVIPDHALVEIVDPQTGEPRGEGEPGEIVVTNLDARGTLLLRFKTGDLAQGGITYEPCPGCGRAFPRLLGNIDRKSNYCEVNTGEDKKTLDFNRFRRKLFEYPWLKQWYLEINEGASGDELKLVIFAPEAGGQEDLTGKLARKMEQDTGIPIRVESSTLEEIINRQGMERRITEKRLFDLRENR